MSSIERVEALLPAFEAAVYDPLIKRDLMLGLDLQALDEDVVDLRRRIAMSSLCEWTCRPGEQFLHDARLTRFRREEHDTRIATARPTDSWWHTYLVEPVTDGFSSGNDLVVDPNYLQFAKNPKAEALEAVWPNVFVGTRAAIRDIVSDPAFNPNPVVSWVYDPETLIND